MGVGEPVDLIEGVARGVDIFDCVSPTRLARHGNALIYGVRDAGISGFKEKRVNLKNARFKHDFTPIEDDCDCYCCQNYTKAYIHHLMRCDETFGATLLSIHNIRFLIRLCEKMREAIREDRFAKFREEFLAKQ